MINPKQVFISVLQRGVNNQVFNFSYQNRDNQALLQDLGMTIAKVAERTPGGMLIFFPSYRVLENCYTAWSDYNILDEIEKQKIVLREPKDPT